MSNDWEYSKDVIIRLDYKIVSIVNGKDTEERGSMVNDDDTRGKTFNCPW